MLPVVPLALALQDQVERCASLDAFLEIGNTVDSFSRWGTLRHDLELPCLLQQGEFSVFLLAELSPLIISERNPVVFKHQVKIPLAQPVDGGVVCCHQGLRGLGADRPVRERIDLGFTACQKLVKR